MRTFAHIVNPVKVGASPEFIFAQGVTFETMLRAREEARGKADIQFYSAQFPEDHAIIPPAFRKTPDLQRSVLDCGKFKKRRKLPLLKDILNRLYECAAAEYFIYTNVDISLTPFFYIIVDQFIDEGLDAFTVTRRNISDRYKSLHEIPLMWAEVGEPHPGQDCFVFKREDYPKYDLGNGAIGIPFADAALFSNMLAHSGRFHAFTSLHLTFHLGNELPWSRLDLKDYLLHNALELRKILNSLKRKGLKKSHPWLDKHIGRYVRRILVLGHFWRFWAEWFVVADKC